jgi:hypothetical protein
LKALGLRPQRFAIGLSENPIQSPVPNSGKCQPSTTSFNHFKLTPDINADLAGRPNSNKSQLMR